MNRVAADSRSTVRGVEGFAPAMSAGDKILRFGMIVMGMSLHQTAFLAGVNSSLADAVLILVLVVFFARNELLLPKWAVGVFLIASLVGMTTAFIVTPLRFDIDPELFQVLTGFIKFVTLSLFWLAGWTGARIGLTSYLLRGYVLGAVIIGAVGAAAYALPLGPLSSQLLYGGFRLRGLMSDPNYFAVMQVSALVLLWSLGLGRWIRWLAAVTIVVSVLLSGSKTGLIVMLAMAVLLAIKPYNNAGGLRASALIRAGAAGIVGIFVFSVVRVDQSFDWLAAQSPSVRRAMAIFVDFGSAIDAGGSNRQAVWQGGVDLINAAPLTGVGFGMYLPTVTAISDTVGVAHNTFIQIAAEFGLVVSLLLVLMLIVGLLKRWPADSCSPAYLPGVRLSVLTFLVAAGGLSLNNARGFWVMLGVCMVSIMLPLGVSREVPGVVDAPQTSSVKKREDA